MHITGKEGNTALHVAANKGHTLTVEYFLAHGVGVHETNNSGESAFDVREEGNKELEELLRFDETSLTSNAVVNSSGGHEELLISTVRRGDSEYVRSCPSAAITFNHTDHMGSTALHIASRKGCEDIFVELQKYGFAIENRD